MKILISGLNPSVIFMTKGLDDFFSGRGLKVSFLIEQYAGTCLELNQFLMFGGNGGLGGKMFVYLLFIRIFMTSSFLPSTVCSEAVEMVMLCHNESDSRKG